MQMAVRMQADEIVYVPVNDFRVDRTCGRSCRRMVATRRMSEMIRGGYHGSSHLQYEISDALLV
jgi:hypothetical protein